MKCKRCERELSKCEPVAVLTYWVSLLKQGVLVIRRTGSGPLCADCAFEEGADREKNGLLTKIRPFEEKLMIDAIASYDLGKDMPEVVEEDLSPADRRLLQLPM